MPPWEAPSLREINLTTPGLPAPAAFSSGPRVGIRLAETAREHASAVREWLEETGIAARVMGLLGIRPSDPCIVAYSDAELRHE